MENKRCQTASDGANVYLLALLANLFVQMLASAVMIISGGTGDATTGTLNIIFMALIQCAFLGVTALYLKKTKVKLTLVPTKISVKSGLLSACAAVTTVCCFLLPAQWFAWGLEKLGYAFSDGVSFSTPLQIVLGVLVTVVLAPVVEELVFRGALLGSLVRKTGAVRAIVLSGACFALMHMSPEQTVYQFFLGCACAYLTLCSRSVTPAIITHATSNLIAVLLSFASTGGESYALPHPIAAAIVTVVLLGSGVAIITFIGKKLSGKGEDGVKLSVGARLELNVLACRDGEERDGFFGKQGFIIPLAAGLVISAAMWAVVFVTAII